jgi:hypothetical protein
MLQIGDQADVLRALGCWLDEQEAREVQISNQGPFLAVSWQAARQGGHHRTCQEHELTALRLAARQLRQGHHGNSSGAQGGQRGSGPLAELLRTLGQELDQSGLKLDEIVQESDAFRVSGTVADAHFSERYETATLLRMSAQRRARRAAGGEEAGVDRFLAALPGLRVVTVDWQSLGEVAEVRHEQFKVRTGRFQRDYWLPTSTVANVVPGQEVVLRCPRQEVDQLKRHRPAPAPVSKPGGERRELSLAGAGRG